MHLRSAEFYITNVCNLSCNGCNRFNNHKFKGLQRWADYKDVYAQWAKEVKIGNIGILGGEPLLNPDIIEWISGIRELWPYTKIKIVTNGFQLDKVKNLYDYLASDKNTTLWVGVHNKMHKKMIVDKVKNFMQGEVTYEFNTDNQYQQYMWMTDGNGVRIKIEYNWWFHQGALVTAENGFTLHNSDVDKAHNNCHMNTCHHFIRGELYKCGVVALLPEFNEQNKLSLSTDDLELMQSYRSLNIHDSRETKIEFVNNLPKSIPQCKFCPEVYNGDQIFSLEKKEVL